MSGAGADSKALVPHPGFRVRRTTSYGAALILSNSATFRAAASKVKKSVTTLQRAMERFRNTGSYEGVSGKPAMLSQMELIPLRELAHQRGLVGNHMTSKETVKKVGEMVQQRAAAEGRNPDGAIVSERATNAFLRKNNFKFVTAANTSTQTLRRAESGSDVRNHASLAAALRANLFANPLGDAPLTYCVPPTNVFNLDALGLKLASDGAQVETLVSTPETLEELNRRHADAARIGTGKRTLYTPSVYLLSNAAGAVPTVVFLLKDKKLTSTGSKVFRSDSLNNIGSANRSGSIYIAATTTKYFNEKEFMTKMIEEDFIPAMKQVAHKDAPILLLLDGDIPQVQATFQPKVHALFATERISVLKLPAACSHTTQPNDLSRMHPNLRKATDNVMKEMKNSQSSKKIEPIPDYFPALETWLNTNSKLGSDVKQLVTHFFKHAPSVLSRSLAPGTVMSGYTTTGIYPYDHVKILMQCTTFPQMTGETAAVIKNALIPMTSEFMKEGWCNEQVMDELKIPSREEVSDEFKEILEIEQELQNKTKKKKKKSLNEMVEWRQRTMMLSHSRTQQRRQHQQDAEEAAKRQKVEEKEQKKQETELRKRQKVEEKEKKKQETELKKVAAAKQKMDKLQEKQQKQQQQQQQQKQEAVKRKSSPSEDADEKTPAKKAKRIIRIPNNAPASVPVCHTPNCINKYPLYGKSQNQWTFCVNEGRGCKMASCHQCQIPVGHQLKCPLQKKKAAAK